jgi:hypothetical protein
VKISEINLRTERNLRQIIITIWSKKVGAVGGTFKSFVRRTIVTFFTVYQYVSVNVVKWREREKQRERENE